MKTESAFKPGDKVTYQKSKKERGNAVINMASSAKKNHFYIDTEKEGKILVSSGELEMREGLETNMELKQLIENTIKEKLDESKNVDDFMKLMKIKSEPNQGTRLNFAGYPFDYDEYEDGDVYLDAVDTDAAKGLVKELKKKGFKAYAKNKTVTIQLNDN